jgi:hypothetical protein
MLTPKTIRPTRTLIPTKNTRDRSAIWTSCGGSSHDSPAIEAPCLALEPAWILDLPATSAAAIAVARAAILQNDPFETAVRDVEGKRFSRLDEG